MPRRQSWMDKELAVTVVVEYTLTQGAHVVYDGASGMFQVRKGGRDSRIHKELTDQCYWNSYIYCGYYNQQMNVAGLIEDLDFIVDNYKKDD